MVHVTIIAMVKVMYGDSFQHNTLEKEFRNQIIPVTITKRILPCLAKHSHPSHMPF